MRVADQKTLQFAIEGVIIAVLTIVAIYLGVHFFGTGGSVDRHTVLIQFDQYISSEKLFYSRYATYRGSCTDTSLPAGVRCVTTPNTYKIEQNVDTGKVYCADSTGFRGVLPAPTGSTATACH